MEKGGWQTVFSGFDASHIYAILLLDDRVTSSGFVVSPTFPAALQSDVDAFSQYNYPAMGGLVNGSPPYSNLVAAS